MKTLKTLLMAAAATAIATSAMAADIAVVGGKADDPFFAVIKRGVDDAATVVEEHGGSVNFLQLQTYDNIGPDAGNLVRTATSQGVQGIAVPNWVPEAEDEAIKAAIDAGIVVMIYNSGGIEKADELGAVSYIGSDEYIAGVAGGEYFGDNGQKNVICVNTVPGAQNLESRCQGVIDGITAKGGAAKQLPLPASSFGDPTAVAEAIKATLLQDDTIDGVITISAGDADSAASGIMQAGKTETVQLGTFDMNQANLDRIQNGTQLFAIDQQPYLQGFLAVSLLNSYIDYGLDVPTRPILTGPGIVDASNIKSTLAGVEQGAR